MGLLYPFTAAMCAGWTPLLMASKEGHEAIVRLLLERGADLAPQAVAIASAQGHEAVARLLEGANRPGRAAEF